MRQFRRVVIGLALLFGGWLVWRQVTQRRHRMGRYDYAPRSPLPEWSAAPMPTPDPSMVTGTAERTHNQTDNLTQAKEPAVPEQKEGWYGVDTTLHNVMETDAESEGVEDTAAP